MVAESEYQEEEEDNAAAAATADEDVDGNHWWRNHLWSVGPILQ